MGASRSSSWRSRSSSSAPRSAELAQNMVQLVVFRAIQGVGAGGIFPLTLAMVGMIVPPRDRGRYQGLIGSVFAAASIVGPLIGGFIVDNASWRWIFYVNLPVGGLALVVILITMPKRAYQAGALRSIGSARGSSRWARPRSCSGSSGAGATTRGAPCTCSAPSLRRSCCSPSSGSGSGVCRSRSCRSTCCATRRLRPASRAWRSWAWRCSARSATCRSSCRV